MGSLEGDELTVGSTTKYDANRDGRIEADEMLTAIAGVYLPTPINLTSSQSRSEAAEVAQRILDILAKPSPSEQVDDPIELGQYKELEIDHDLEHLKSSPKKSLENLVALLIPRNENFKAILKRHQHQKRRRRALPPQVPKLMQVSDRTFRFKC